MKAYANTLLYILLLIDFIMLISLIGFGVELEELYFAILVINLIMGPLQFIPSLFLLLDRKFQNKWMGLYYALSAVLIFATLLLAIYDVDSVFDSKVYLAIIMCLCYILAHFYSPIIHTAYKK